MGKYCSCNRQCKTQSSRCEANASTFLTTLGIRNTMVDQLRTFATEVTRVARDVGTEGLLGGQAQIVGVQGMWSELTVNVNVLAQNLTSQVRDIATVTSAVATGDLTQKVEADCKGEILELKTTIVSVSNWSGVDLR